MFVRAGTARDLFPFFHNAISRLQKLFNRCSQIPTPQKLTQLRKPPPALRPRTILALVLAPSPQRPSPAFPTFLIASQSLQSRSPTFVPSKNQLRTPEEAKPETEKDEICSRGRVYVCGSEDGILACFKCVQLLVSDQNNVPVAALGAALAAPVLREAAVVRNLRMGFATAEAFLLTAVRARELTPERICNIFVLSC